MSSNGALLSSRVPKYLTALRSSTGDEIANYWFEYTVDKDWILHFVTVEDDSFS